MTYVEKKIIRTSLLTVLLACGLSAQGATSGPSECEVHGIKIDHSQGNTRAVFDLSLPCQYKTLVLGNPDRVVVDIANATSRFDHRTVALQASPITCIRSAVQPDATLRYVFDVTQKPDPPLLIAESRGLEGQRLLALDFNMPVESGANPEPVTAARPGVESPSPIESGPETQPPSPTGAPAAQAPGGLSLGEWSGSISLDTRLFFQSPAYSRQDDQNVSVALQPEYYLDWADGRQRFAFSPFFRYDANDDRRTHADVRELYWRIDHQRILFKAGVDVVFWGVTESQHLVDIINQTDLIENIDEEDKLGQPMLNLDYMTDWGTWQFYVLPYFRERTFPGERGRLRSEPVVRTSGAVYESGSEENHVDFAARWSHYIGDWDIGLAHFSGTGREPLLILSDSGREPRLVPYYQQIDQTSLDAQATKGAWLWKLEAIYNDNNFDSYYAYVGGFEFTQFGVAGSAADLGWLLEYHYDDRDDMSATALQDDIYLGLRLTGNDIADTRLLAGVIVDTDSRFTFANLEMSRRLGESWTLGLEARLFLNIDGTEQTDPLFVINDALYSVRDDDYIEIQLTRHF